MIDLETEKTYGNVYILLDIIETARIFIGIFITLIGAVTERT